MVLPIGLKNLRALTVERAAAACEKLCLSQIFDDIALHVPLNELITPANQFHFLAAFIITSVRTLPYFFEAVPDRVDGPGGLTSHFRIYTVVQIETALRVTAGLVSEIAARKRVPLLEAPIMAALVSLSRSLMQSSLLNAIVSEVLEQQ